MNKTALVIRHQSSVHLGTFAETLALNNINIRYVDTYKDDINEIDPLEHDYVILLGGVFGVYNQDEYPVLKDELAFVKKRIDADKPLLGVCLGSQMIAAALGADVYPGKQGFELGWKPLTIHDEGQNSPIRHFDPALTQMFISHGDTFDLPEGAVLLASSDQYPHQAYSYGNNILAVQFHPEVDEGLAEEFLILLVSKLTDSTDMDIHTIRAQTTENIGNLKAQTSKFLSEWLQNSDTAG